jgi:3-hydroxy-9,10-secoandrosta-1,3,5(10)-triene-9,17-dione monooxygenase reductase component
MSGKQGVAISPEMFRTVLGHVPTAVTVVTAMDDGEPVGLAVGTFCSISLDPALVGFFVAKSSTSWPRMRRANAFCANVLAADQAALSDAFSRSGGNKFEGLSWSLSQRCRQPVLARALAWIDCIVEDVAEMGDHELVVGRVLELGTGAHYAAIGGPLVSYRGQLSGLGEAAAGVSGCPAARVAASMPVRASC